MCAIGSLFFFPPALNFRIVSFLYSYFLYPYVFYFPLSCFFT